MRAHVLLIDDEPDTMGSVLHALRQQDWRVDVAVDGKQGVDYARTLVPDLILLDVFMPHMDGFAVCRLLRDTPATQATPILFLTGAESDTERLTGLAGGAVDYILKPCLPAEVVARVRIHLRLGKRLMARPDQPHALLSSDEVVVRAAMRLISEHLAALPSLVDLAGQVGTHDKRLSALFREHLGMPVFGWVREERLRLGRDLLANTDLSIADIAARVGFHSAGNFATAFRQRVGTTPTRYRERAREAQSNVV